MKRCARDTEGSWFKRQITIQRLTAYERDEYLEMRHGSIIDDRHDMALGLGLTLTPVRWER